MDRELNPAGTAFTLASLSVALYAVLLIAVSCESLNSAADHKPGVNLNHWEKAELSWQITSMTLATGFAICEAIEDKCPLTPIEIALARQVLAEGNEIVERYGAAIASGELEEASVEDHAQRAATELSNLTVHLAPLVLAVHQQTSNGLRAGRPPAP